MTTLNASPVKPADEKSVEKQVYSIVERYKENIPIDNDRNRLAFTLVKYILGEGDAPEMAVKVNKLTLTGITEKELAKKLANDLKSVEKPE